MVTQSVSKDQSTYQVLRAFYFANKSLYSQSYGFSSSCVWMWELDHKEAWAPNNWCFRTVVLEKTLESPLESKEIKPVNPKGNQPCYSLKDWCWSFNTLFTWWEETTIVKDPDAGEKDWGQEKGVIALALPAVVVTDHIKMYLC